MAAVQSAIGFLELALCFIAHAPVDIGVGILRVESQGRSEVGKGFVEFTLLPVSDAPVAIGIATFRVKPQRLGVVGDSLFAVTLLFISDCSVIVGVGFGGVEPNSFRVVGDLPVVLALISVGTSSVCLPRLEIPLCSAAVTDGGSAATDATTHTKSPNSVLAVNDKHFFMAVRHSIRGGVPGCRIGRPGGQAGRGLTSGHFHGATKVDPLAAPRSS